MTELVERRCELSERGGCLVGRGSDPASIVAHETVTGQGCCDAAASKACMGRGVYGMKMPADPRDLSGDFGVLPVWIGTCDGIEAAGTRRGLAAETQMDCPSRTWSVDNHRKSAGRGGAVREILSRPSARRSCFAWKREREVPWR